jgi:hypothetical protein
VLPRRYERIAGAKIVKISITWKEMGKKVKKNLTAGITPVVRSFLVGAAKYLLSLISA